MRNQIQFSPHTRVRRLFGVLMCGLILGLAAPGGAAANATFNIELVGAGTVVSSPSGIDCTDTGGSTTGACSSAEFAPFSTVELTAIAGPSSQFEGWIATEEYGDCYFGAANPCSFAPGFAGQATFTAHFTSTGPQQPLEVKLTGAGGGGEVASSPSGIECGTKCEAEFSEGSTVVLTAQENEHSTFVGWIGCSNVNAEDKCEVTMSAAKTVEAKFNAIPQQILEVRKTGSGEVTSSPSGIECGATCTNHFNEHSTVTLTAIPAPAIPGARYTFGGWTGCSNVTTEDKCEVTMSEAKSVEAEFDVIPQQALKVQETGTGSGEVTSAPPGIRCSGGTCQAEFDEDATVTLAATPSSESVFAGWSGGGCTGTAPCEVTLAAATTVTAAFEPVPSPTASTGEATEITQTTTRLFGMVDGRGFDTHYLFDYGETASFGRQAPSNSGVGEDTGVVSANTPETIEVSGLTPNTTYHYEIVAYNIPCRFFCPRSGPNTVEGGERTFTTLPLVPAVTTDVPVTVGSGVAVVGGEVVAQGAQASYLVEYGATEVLGSNTPRVSAGSRAAGVYVTATLEGLQSNTTYYYRVTATNSGGEELGKIERFTTNTSGEAISTLSPGFSLTQTSTPLGNPTTLSFPNLTSLGPSLPAKTTATTKTKPFTRAQKLAKALKSCKKDRSKAKRQACEKQAKQKYATKSKPKSKK